MAYGSEAVVLNIESLLTSFISINVSPIGLFMLYFSLLMGDNLATVIILARAVVSLRGLYILAFLAEVVILVWPSFFDILSRLRRVMSVGPLFISLEIVSNVG